MARPIKSTPRLSGKASYDFQKELKENEGKKVVLSLSKPGKKLERKIMDDAPEW